MKFRSIINNHIKNQDYSDTDSDSDYDDEVEDDDSDADVPDSAVEGSIHES